MSDLKAIADAVIAGEADRIKELIQGALDQGMGVQQVLDDGIIAGMNVVGENFKKEEIFLPEVLFSARTMKAGMEILEPLMLSGDVEAKGKIILGTVKADVHDIGKNLVGIMLKGAGFEVIDLGIDVPPEKFIEAIHDHNAPLVGLSALTGTTMPNLKVTLDALEAAGLKDKIKTMVGGAIVTQSYADNIGADGYAPDAASAAQKAKELLGIT